MIDIGTIIYCISNFTWRGYHIHTIGVYIVKLIKLNHGTYSGPHHNNVTLADPHSVMPKSWSLWKCYNVSVDPVDLGIDKSFKIIITSFLTSATPYIKVSTRFAVLAVLVPVHALACLHSLRLCRWLGPARTFITITFICFYFICFVFLEGKLQFFQ